ncbi:hypothetical protein L2E82_40087 [Cichorium intybus]|uniref:Uncharacterized protein n=1 Tax=Cichorium intybus TaxID=13427 RepID=A0ACB9AJA7_CICIN|nr:hypothetical protein L2E82_40087 [Cichorium intybus]
MIPGVSHEPRFLTRWAFKQPLSLSRLQEFKFLKWVFYQKQTLLEFNFLEVGSDQNQKSFVFASSFKKWELLRDWFG